MEEERMEVKLGGYGGKVRVLEWDTESDLGAAEETMLLWGIQQPTLSKQNAFVSHSSLQLRLDACGHSLNILQSPSSLGKPGVTGSVMWDSGVVLGKFLEHAVDLEMLLLQGKKVIELGSGCGLVGCIAALLGAQVILTDLPDRLRLLRKNIETNLRHGMRGSAVVSELTWGDDPDNHLIEPLPDYGLFCLFHLEKGGARHKRHVSYKRGLEAALFDMSCIFVPSFLVLGSDVIYSEGAVVDLLDTLIQLCGPQTTVFLSGELRNDTVLECFLEAAVKDFVVGRVDQSQWHPDYCSPRVVMYILVKKSG